MMCVWASTIVCMLLFISMFSVYAGGCVSGMDPLQIWDMPECFFKLQSKMVQYKTSNKIFKHENGLLDQF